MKQSKIDKKKLVQKKVLKALIKEQIQTTGPMDLYEYMTLCQYHPLYGYYTSKESADIFGQNGDFITSSGVSAIFGEILAVWVMLQWQKIGSPATFCLLELGPGNGTLMEDVLRTLKRFKRFDATIHLKLLEVNYSLQVLQQEKLSSYVYSLEHLITPQEILGIEMPLIIIANELLDALPCQHYLKQKGIWNKRVVTIDDKGDLIFGLEETSESFSEEDGTIVEIQPDIEQIMGPIGITLKKNGGSAVIIDYGYWKGHGDTLQAVYKHSSVGIFDKPGESDLSAHVCFESIDSMLKMFGLQTIYSNQRNFLISHGIDARAHQLISAGLEQTDIENRVNRLISPDEMGTLFKVLQVYV